MVANVLGATEDMNVPRNLHAYLYACLSTSSYWKKRAYIRKERDGERERERDIYIYTERERMKDETRERANERKREREKGDKKDAS